jgi:serine/threonine protein kinase
MVAENVLEFLKRDRVRRVSRVNASKASAWRSFNGNQNVGRTDREQDDGSGISDILATLNNLRAYGMMYGAMTVSSGDDVHFLQVLVVIHHCHPPLPPTIMTTPSSRRQGRTLTVHNGGGSNVGEKLDKSKKNASSITMAFKRLSLRLTMLPRGVQVLVMISAAILICLPAGYLIISILQQQSRDPLSTFVARPRVLQVTFDDELHQIVSVSVATSMGPSIPTYKKIVAKYNSLPNLGKVAKLDSASSMDKGECIHMYDWQAGNNPTCNTVHEMSSFFNQQPFVVRPTNNKKNNINNNSVVENGRLVNNGGYRDIFMVREWDGTKRVLKTLRTTEDNEEFDLRNADRHRRDAVAMDALQKSPLIVKIYGYCTNSGLFRFSAEGALDGIFEREPHISKDRLLHLAYNASLSISHAHHYDERGRATIAHTDIKFDQFLYEDGYYKLMDFNRNRFLRWNNEEDKRCNFEIPGAPGRWRSPEEYNHKGLTEKVDVYSLGNVLYFLLTRNVPFRDISFKKVGKHVRNGERPYVSKEIRYSGHPFDKYMIEAINMCFTTDPDKRPSAKQVADKLAEGIAKLGQAVPPSSYNIGRHAAAIPPKRKKYGNSHYVSDSIHK